MSQNLDCSSQLVSPEEKLTFSTPPAFLYNETPISFLSHLSHSNPKSYNELDQTTLEVFPKLAYFPASNHSQELKVP